MAFMVAISSSKLFIPIVMIGMTMVLQDSPSVSNWKVCLNDGEEESTSQGGVGSFEGLWGLSIEQDTFCYKSCCLDEDVVMCLTTTTVTALAILPVSIHAPVFWEWCQLSRIFKREIRCSSLKIVRQSFLWPWLL